MDGLLMLIMPGTLAALLDWQISSVNSHKHSPWADLCHQLINHQDICLLSPGC
jgi:hypothetical protein